MSTNGGKLRQLFLDRFKVTLEDAATYREMMTTLDNWLPRHLSIVGNAASLLRGQYGAAIDSQVTIRFNSAEIIDEDAQGARWDIVATSNEGTLRHYRDVPPRFSSLLFTPYLDKHLNVLHDVGASVPVFLCPMRLSRQIGWCCLARPTTGMQVLYLLSKLGQRDIDIFGFDWKETPTYYDQLRTNDPHRHDRERIIAEYLIRRHGWKLHVVP